MREWGVEDCSILDFDSLRGSCPPGWPTSFGQTARLQHSLFDKQIKESVFADDGFKLLMVEHELYTGHADVSTDVGAFLYADKTLTRFFMVERYVRAHCSSRGIEFSMDYERFLELAARRMFNLITYLPLSDSGPKWATCSSWTDPSLPVKFFSIDSGSVPTPTGQDPLKFPPILHLKPKNTPPVLSANDLVPLNCLLLRAGLPLPPLQVRRKVVSDTPPERVTEHLAHKGETARQEPVKRPCAGCGLLQDVGNLNRCSACRMAFFCNRDCQRKGWKEHKKVCMPKGA
ncbi:hypothetical protein JCM6882_007345 [Rhodosporidiobolus microsporus]